MLTLKQALVPIAASRGERIVITTMSAVGVWPTLSDTPRDFAYLPSSMGQAIPLGLGLALARPGTGVIVIMGDGGLLMNLGCLVTLAEYPTIPLCVVLIDNGLYEVTGGQTLAGAGRTDFGQIARGCGITQVSSFTAIQEWEAAAPEHLQHPGPSFVWLKVQGERGKATPTAPRPMAEQIERLRGIL